MLPIQPGLMSYKKINRHMLCRYHTSEKNDEETKLHAQSFDAFKFEMEKIRRRRDSYKEELATIACLHPC